MWGTDEELRVNKWRGVALRNSKCRNGPKEKKNQGRLTRGESAIG